MVVSTLCKNCGAYLKIERGVIINHDPPSDLPKVSKLEVRNQSQCSEPPAPAPPKPLAPPPPLKPAAEKSLESIPSLEKEKAPFASEPTRYKPPLKEGKPSSSPLPVPKALDSLLNRKERKRSVRCFDCQHEHEILVDSTSALCPRCGAYIGLKDFDIREQHNSRIQTRGSVFVHKKGSVTGITIQCHHLTIEGDIHGGADCSGDFIIRKTGKIVGPVTCDRLIVERKAMVDFMAMVQAREVTIDGNVTGNIICKKLLLQKRATLDGDITVVTMSIQEGANLSGKITMVPA